jgi:hypothetical protein
MLKRLPAFLMLIAAVALFAAACGDSGSGGTTPVDISPPTPIEDQLKPIEHLTDQDLIHFLNRTHFGYRPADLEKIQQMGYEAYLDWMLDLQLDPQLEAEAMSANVQDADFPSAAELARWWIWLMVHNPNAFQERLALFWHDHFATSSSVLVAQSRYWFFDHINLWRTKGADVLVDMLYAMATDWTMLIWLDGYLSTNRAPNENFARELWELFTLGVDNGYTQDDIEEASRAFTGYRRILVPDRAGPGRDQFVMVFDPARHDDTAKTIFGLHLAPNGEQEYRDVIDMTILNRPVAHFIVRKIWEEFVYEDPPFSVVHALGTRLSGSGYNLKDLLKTIFLSEAFFSPRAKEGMIKSPIEYNVGFMRTTGLKLTPTRIDNNLIANGHRPTQPPDVDGWPSGDFWLSSQGLLERTNFLTDCVRYRNEAPQAGYDVGDLMLPGQTSDEEVVDRLAYLLQVKLTPGQRDECISYLNSDANASSVFAQPWDFDDPVQREKKIRGLLWILGQHPDYHQR